MSDICEVFDNDDDDGSDEDDDDDDDDRREIKFAMTPPMQTMHVTIDSAINGRHSWVNSKTSGSLKKGKRHTMPKLST